VDIFHKNLGIPEQYVPDKQATINQRDIAFESGAQFISTDYFMEPEHIGDYWVRMPNGVKTAYRCNPVTTTDINCSNHDFEIENEPIGIHDEVPTNEETNEEEIPVKETEKQKRKDEL